MKTIAIIGGGFSGAMTAVHLMRNANFPLKIILIEKDEVARGVAFAKADECFLLNVRADQMGAFPEEPEHFYKWLLQNKITANPQDFISRNLYGDYVDSIFKQELKQSKFAHLEIIKNKAIDIDILKKEIVFETHHPLRADQIILANGLDSIKPLNWKAIASSNEDVTIIGTGLSMIDTVIYLDKLNYKGKITAISRYGRIPSVHEFYSPEIARPVYDFKTNHALSYVFKTVKENLKKYEWRLVIDSLRPHNQFLWKHFSDKEKSQFMRYLRSLWDVHRHRMSFGQKKIIEALVANNRLVIKANGHKSAIARKGIVLEFKGFSLGNNSENKLIQNLLLKKIIQTDLLKLGIKSDVNGAVHEDWIYTLGALRRGDLWECTAVPDIRKQAQELATYLINKSL